METARQVLDALTDRCADRAQTAYADRLIFRAGVWKPRTSPRTFQGVGEEGLAWLQEVKETFGIAVATEVATPEQVDLALKAGIDYLWIGARTSANPIAVQQIASQIHNSQFTIHNYSLKGLLIKNPVNADAGLWLGNIERLEKTGVPVLAVHRGCNHQPCWAMAHAVREARPDIPMLLDPSHMCGDAAKVPELIKKVDELGLDGAMVEVHCCPEKALSDAKQQLSPLEIAMTLEESLTNHQRITNESPTNHLSITRESPANHPRLDKELVWMRAEIDELDEQLWSTIAARMEVSERIGAWKKVHGVAPLQPERYKQLVERLKNLRVQKFKDLNISEDFLLKVWELIHEESLRVQK